MFNQPMRDRLGSRVIKEDDMQTFSLLRFVPPELDNFEGCSITLDPDIFCVRTGLMEAFGDFNSSDMSIAAKPNLNGYASSVIFAKNEYFRRWNFAELIAGLINQKIDYSDLMSLNFFKTPIYALGECLNDFDNLGNDTILLHTTNRISQPWRVGLKFNSHVKKPKPFLKVIPRRVIWRLLGRPTWEKHIEHPNKMISDLFFRLANEAISNGFLNEREIQKAVENGYVRQDFFDCLERTK